MAWQTPEQPVLVVPSNRAFVVSIESYCCIALVSDLHRTVLLLSRIIHFYSMFAIRNSQNRCVSAVAVAPHTAQVKCCVGQRSCQSSSLPRPPKQHTEKKRALMNWGHYPQQCQHSLENGFNFALRLHRRYPPAGTCSCYQTLAEVASFAPGRQHQPMLPIQSKVQPSAGTANHRSHDPTQ